MRLKVIFNTTGIMLKFISLIFIFPVIFAFFYKEFDSIAPFIVSSLLTFLLGFLFCKNDAKEKDIDTMNRTEAFACVCFVWTMFSLVCTIPFLFYNMPLIDAFFEAVSGVSTTGATVLNDFSLYPKTFFMYRSMTQWLGGMGIIVLFIAVLPKFAVAGRQMFFAEAPNPTEEKITPRIRHTASWLWSIYIVLSVIQLVCLKIQGLDFYNSLCFTFSTISAGGFSNDPNSLIGAKRSLVWTIGFFSFLAGVNFILTYKVLIKGKIKEALKSEEFLTYFGIVFLFTVLITLILFFEHNMSVSDSIRNAFFEISNTITSTGFSSDNYINWSIRAQALLFTLMFIGGSAISASGSIKITRWIYVAKYIKKEMNKIVHPTGIYPIKLEGRTVAPDIGHQIIIFIIFFMALFATSTIIVTLIEQNPSTALTGSIATLSNTGPAFNSAIGPLGNYQELNVFTKMIFIFNMFIGRLEIIPFLALLQTDLWRFKK